LALSFTTEAQPLVEPEAPGTGTFLTFNIAHARGLGLHQGLRSVVKLKANLLKIARLIQRLEADIVALQGD